MQYNMQAGTSFCDVILCCSDSQYCKAMSLNCINQSFGTPSTLVSYTIIVQLMAAAMVSIRAMTLRMNSTVSRRSRLFIVTSAAVGR